VLFLSGTNKISAQTYRTVSGGSWSNPANWEVLVAILWTPTLTAPSGSGVTVDIRAGHTINLTDARIINKATVSGMLNIQSGGSVSIANAFLSTGEMTINAGGVLQSWGGSDYSSEISYASGAKINISSQGKIIIGTGAAINGANLNEYATGANSVWSSGAVFDWNSTTPLPTSGLTYFPGIAASVKPLLVVDNTGGSMGSSGSTVINGMLSVRSPFSLTGSGSKTIRDGIAGNATLTIPASSGAIVISGSAPILGGSNLSIITDKSISIPNGITIPADSSVRIITGTGAVLSGKVTSDIVIDGVMDMGTATIDNSNGTVTINGTLKTAHPNGLEGGTINTPSIVNVNAGSTIEYNAAGNQLVTASAVLEGTGKYSNIVFSGSGIKSLAGVVTAEANVKVSGSAIADALLYNLGSAGATLTMDGGRLQLATTGTQPIMAGSYNLTGGTVQFGANSTPQTIRGGAEHTYFIVEVAGSNISTQTDDIFLKPGGIFTVKSTGVLTTTAGSINGPTGSQAFIMETGAVLNCENESGFNGPMITTAPAVSDNIENISLNAGSTINYRRAGAQIITNSTTYQNLLLSGSGEKTAAGNLGISGNLVKSGTSVFKHNKSRVFFSGTASQTFSNTSGFAMEFYDLTNSSGNLTINSDSLAIDNELNLSNGSKLHLGSGNIIMRSTAGRTAHVSPVPNEAGIIDYPGTGRFIVERYLPAIKAWRFITAPVSTTGSPSISASWREGGAAVSAFGTKITGPAGSIGMDTITAGYSMKWYNMGTNAYIPVTNTNAAIANTTGYMLYVRGDRNTGTTGSTTATSLRAKGQIRTGDQSFTINPQAFQSVGNPYAAAISFPDLLAATPGLASYYVAWDPSLNGSYGAGGFQTLSAVDGYRANAVASETDTSSLYIPGSHYPAIESGQAVFMYNPTGSIVFPVITEMMKENESRIASRENSMEDRGFIRTKLLVAGGEIADGNLVAFDDEFENGFDGDDAIKFTNSGENFGMSRFGKKLSVEARERLSSADTIFYNMANLKEQAYTILVEPENMTTEPYVAWFVDKYLDNRTPVHLNEPANIPIAITADPLSRAAGRFMLVFESMAVLPVNILSISTTLSDHGAALIKWEAGNEINILKYETEKSNNGRDFFRISTNQATHARWYSSLDEDPFAGENFYRIRVVGINGDIRYSNVVRFVSGKRVPDIIIFPNPVKDKHIQLRFTKQPAGNFQITITDQQGRQVYSSGILKKQANPDLHFFLDASLASGIYQLGLIENDHKPITQPVIIL
jgi:hypothetical protein